VDCSEPLWEQRPLAEIERIHGGGKKPRPTTPRHSLSSVSALSTGRLEEIQRIRAETNSLVIGLVRDHHHSLH